MDVLEENILRIKDQIADASVKSGRKPEQIRLVAVTKTVDCERINRAIKLGVIEIGENRLQETVQKRPFLRLDGVKVHHIGSVQTNKIRAICENVDMIQSVGSIIHAREIDRRAEQLGRIMPVLIQVNIGEEPQKGGVLPIELDSILEAALGLGQISVKGLMAIPPVAETPEGIRRYFAEMRRMFDNLKGRFGISPDVLSMGMSADFTQAIEEGSTMVRIGTALFGVRTRL